MHASRLLQTMLTASVRHLAGGWMIAAQGTQPVARLPALLVARPASRQCAADGTCIAHAGGLGGPLHTLLGLQSSPFKHGGFLFEHPSSGFVSRPRLDCSVPRIQAMASAAVALFAPLGSRPVVRASSCASGDPAPAGVRSHRR